jgi:hypothetical protein
VIEDLPYLKRCVPAKARVLSISREIIQVQCIDGFRCHRCPVIRANKVFPVLVIVRIVKFEGDIKMIAFYVTLAVLGAALISKAAALQAQKRASLQPVRIRNTDRRQR